MLKERMSHKLRKASPEYWLWNGAAAIVGSTIPAGKRCWDIRWKILRLLIIERDGGCCVQCGKKARYGGAWLEVDHIVMVSQGGDYSPSNLRTLCVPHHKARHGRGKR